MKSFFYVLAMTILLSACKDKGKVTTTEVNEDGTETTTTVDVKSMQENMVESGDEMTKKIEELKKLAPLSMDELKKFVPEELLGIKRSNYNAHNTLGFSAVEGDYQKNDSSQLKVSVFDCAGDAGSGIYSINYWTKMSFQQESSDGYTKTVDMNGAKAVESYTKNNNEHTLTFLANDRLLVTLTGRNMSPDDLKQAAQALNLKAS